MSVTKGWSIAAKLAYSSTDSDVQSWGGTPCRVWLLPLWDGYGRLSIGRKTLPAHRLAWEEVHGDVPRGAEVCHHCDNRACVNVYHLFIGTRQDNEADKVAKGRHLFGERHPQAKLSAEQVAAVILDSRTDREIAASLGVSRATIGRIKSRKRWQHISIDAPIIRRPACRRIGAPIPSDPKKLTTEDVIAIRLDSRSLRAIATEYGVTKQAIHAIQRRKAWRHIP